MKQILVLKHMESQNPGIFRRLAAACNVQFNEIDLHAGDTIPDTNSFDGLWVMGGSMNVWEDNEFPWLIEEKQLIRDVVENQRMPFLGICLGHQLLADALGGKTEPTDHPEIGLFPISPTAAGADHPLLKDLPQPSLWINVHRAEVTRLPPGAVSLAHSETCANHVMQIGSSAFSVQFHPEVCEHTVEDWMKIPGIPQALQDLLGQQGIDYFHTSIADYLETHNTAAKQLFQNWLDIVFQTFEEPQQ